MRPRLVLLAPECCRVEEVCVPQILRLYGVEIGCRRGAGCLCRDAHDTPPANAEGGSSRLPYAPHFLLVLPLIRAEGAQR